MLKSFQSTLPVGGATCDQQPAVSPVVISIHAPRGGSDRYNSSNYIATGNISIHAPRGGSDRIITLLFTVLVYFNPRSPWGERPAGSRAKNTMKKFQSTLPVGGAT